MDWRYYWQHFHCVVLAFWHQSWAIGIALYYVITALSDIAKAIEK
jgi:hypothetical protein